jgi:CheY-like chemotaxis protein
MTTQINPAELFSTEAGACPHCGLRHEGPCPDLLDLGFGSNKTLSFQFPDGRTLQIVQDDLEITWEWEARGSSVPSTRILIVEDDLAIGQMLQTMLAWCGGETVQINWETRGLPGIEQARSLSPDVILLDIKLPDVAGTEVLRQLKADPATAHIPVVTMTAFEFSREEMLRAGATEHVGKGEEQFVTPDRLWSLIERVAYTNKRHGAQNE